MRLAGRAADSAFGRVLAGAALALCLVAPGWSLDFRQAYTLALAADPVWAQARAQARADAQQASLGRSGLLPRLDYRYARGRNWSESRQRTALGSSTQEFDYSSYASAFTLTQPLFDAAAYARYREGQARARAGAYTLARARQALAVRVLQAYTDVLYAQDALDLARAQERALQEDARRSARFVAGGEGTVTDQFEIEARLRVVQAQAIEAGDLLRAARNALRGLTGPAWNGSTLAPLQEAGLDVLEEAPLPLARWRELALAGNPELAAQRQLVQASHQRYLGERAGHLPSVRLYARRQLSDSNAENQIGQRYDTSTVGVEINVPIYGGGQTSAASAQALAQEQALQHRLQADTTALLDDLERQFDTLASSRARIQAYQLAARAAGERVRATRRSVLGGERTSLDVLDAERQLAEARRDLARARYDYLLAWLSLRWQAGILAEQDVTRIATLFGTGAPPDAPAKAAVRLPP
ncbi:TolC family outer membrane protein [Orrella sp. JC864]|uniref:TolC family outer membrane protein n=1 Tax=Orrella sp. JC864 TaxID=3120298 RepID=UPI00300AB25E